MESMSFRFRLSLDAGSGSQSHPQAQRRGYTVSGVMEGLTFPN